MNQKMHRYFGDNKADADLGRQSLRSGVVFVAARGVNVFVQVGSTILLARMLSPHDYGLVAMVFALVGFAPMLIDLGMTDAAVQKERITHAEVSALFWLNVAIGSTLAILLGGGSELIARFYGEPALSGIALTSSITFIVAAASAQHYALMRRAMQFQRIAAIEISSNVCSSVVAILMALTGWGYWALVTKPILTTTLSAIGVWISCPWLPGRPRFDRDVKEMVGFGANVTGFTMTDYLARSADRIALGYFFGAGPLGYFQNAFLLYDNLLSLITQPLHNVAVSSLSKLRQSIEEFRRSWAAALSSLCFFAMPAFAILAVTGQDIVVILLGTKWAPAGPLLSVFAFRGIAHVVERTMGWLHIGAGRSDRWMRWGVVSAVCQILALFAGLPFGPIGVAVAYALATFCLFLPALTYAGRPVGIELRDVLRVVGPQVTAALISLSLGLAIHHAFLTGQSQFSRVVFSSITCSAAYLLLIVGVFRVTAPIQIARSLVRDFLPRQLTRNAAVKDAVG